MYNRDYYVPNSWYEPYCDIGPECNGCNKRDKIMEQAAECLTAIMHALYGKGSLDTARLESDLDELCYILNVESNPEDLQIQRKSCHSL